MKLISVCILFICLLSASFSKWLMIGAYTLNQHYIAENLCINKEHPSSHCNGHCYLSRQLNKEEKPSSPFNTNSNEKFEIQLFCIEMPGNEPEVNLQEKKFSVQFLHFTPQPFIQSLFQPPRV